MNRNKTEFAGHTGDGGKREKENQDPLELLNLVMYGNQLTGEQDQAYEDLRKYLLSIRREQYEDNDNH